MGGYAIDKHSSREPWPFGRGFLLLLKELDKVKLGFEAGDEGLFFFDLVLGLFDEVRRGFVYVVRITHAEI